VVREAYPDPTQFDARDDHHDPDSSRDDPRWFQVDVRAVEKLAQPVTLERMKAARELSGWPSCNAGTGSRCCRSPKRNFARREDGKVPVVNRGAAAVAAAVGAAALWAQPLFGCRLSGVVALPFALAAAALVVVAEHRRLESRHPAPPITPLPRMRRSRCRSAAQIVFGALATAGLARMFFAPPPQMPFARVAVSAGSRRSRQSSFRYV